MPEVGEMIACVCVDRQEKALELATAFGVLDFKASNSWFSNFVKRYGLDSLDFQHELLLPLPQARHAGAGVGQAVDAAAGRRGQG
eukprot:1126651-Rhodomonas_salina.2